jgi:hypothetical protein
MEWTNPKPPAIFEPNAMLQSQPHFRRVRLNSNDKEFQDVASLVRRGLPNVTIGFIERIENELLWVKYATAIKYFKKGSEQKLFHGTKPQCVDSISKNGFDYRLANLRGKYGAGIYCSPDSAFSNRYIYKASDGFRRMFVTRFIVGDAFISQRSLPGHLKPGINPATGVEYDTICSSDGKEYITFNNSHIYPEYLVAYDPGI